MQKMRDLLGLPILETDTGAQIGEIHEVILDLEQAIILAFIVREAGWFSDRSGIELAEVASIGRDALMVHSGRSAHDLSGILTQPGIQSLSRLLDKEVFTDSGLALGVLTDIYFEPLTGELRSYELSDGMITDLLFGRKDLPLPKAQVVGAEKVIVPETMVELLHTES